MTALHVSGVSSVIGRSIAQSCSLDHHQDEGRIVAWSDRYSPDNIRVLLGGTGNFAVVVASANAPLGSAALTRSGQINHLFVDPDAQGQGHGRRLLAALENEARRRWFSSLYVDSTATAMPFFVHLGYQVSDMKGLDVPAAELVRLIKFLR